jgi:mono/diheme cytochrome c family protein
MSLPLAAALVSLAAPVRGQEQGRNTGADIYQQSGCVICHGGLGTGGFGPKLAGDPMLAIGQFVIARIINGAGPMPAFGDKLNDQQIAAVTQFIRTSWGNDFGPVTPDQVTGTRNLLQRAAQVAAHVSQAQQ